MATTDNTASNASTSGSTSKSSKSKAAAKGTLVDMRELLVDFSTINWADEMENETLASTTISSISNPTVEQKLSLVQTRVSLPSGPKASRGETVDSSYGNGARPSFGHSGSYGQKSGDQEKSGGGYQQRNRNYNSANSKSNTYDSRIRQGYQQQQQYVHPPYPHQGYDPTAMAVMPPHMYPAYPDQRYQAQGYTQMAPAQHTYHPPQVAAPPADQRYGSMPRRKYDDRSEHGYRSHVPDDSRYASDRAGGACRPPPAASVDRCHTIGGYDCERNMGRESVERMSDCDYIRSGPSPHLMHPQTARPTLMVYNAGRYASETPSLLPDSRHFDRRSMPPTVDDYGRQPPSMSQGGYESSGGGYGTQRMQRSYPNNGEYNEDRHRSNYNHGCGKQSERSGGGNHPPSASHGGASRRASITSSEHRDDIDGTKERPKLNLQPRTKPVSKEVVPPPPAATSSAVSIFGGAKPVDTRRKDEEIEQKQQKERLEAAEKLKKEADERISKEKHDTRQKSISSSADLDREVHHGRSSNYHTRFVPPRQQKRGEQVRGQSPVEDPRPSVTSSFTVNHHSMDEPKLAPQTGHVKILQRPPPTSATNENSEEPILAPLSEPVRAISAAPDYVDKPKKDQNGGGDDRSKSSSRRDSSLDYNGRGGRRHEGGGPGSYHRPPRFQDHKGGHRRWSQEWTATRRRSPGGKAPPMNNMAKSLDESDYRTSSQQRFADADDGDVTSRGGGSNNRSRRGGHRNRRGGNGRRIYTVRRGGDVDTSTGCGTVADDVTSTSQVEGRGQMPSNDNDGGERHGQETDVKQQVSMTSSSSNQNEVGGASNDVTASATSGGNKKKSQKGYSDKSSQQQKAAAKATKPPLPLMTSKGKAPNFCVENKFTLLESLGEID